MSQMLEARQERAARNQLLFRTINEQIKDLGERILTAVEEVDFACECADTSCTKTIRLSPEKFAAINETENRFIVLPGHELSEVEDTLEFCDGFVIVSKRGAGAEYVKENS
jgi:hypothetical protein